MNTLFWGPSAWRLIHSLGLVYPKKPTEKDQKVFFDFFDSLKYVLPCKHCRNSYKDYYKDITEYLPNGKLYEWTFNLHNKVNDKLKKQKLKSGENPDYKESIKIHAINLKNAQKNNTFLGLDLINSIFMDLPNELSENRINKIKKFKSNLNNVIDYLNIPIMTMYKDKPFVCRKKNRDCIIKNQFNKINKCKIECEEKGLPTTKPYTIKQYKEFYDKFVASCGAITCR